MASKSKINQIAVVAVAQGVADMILENYGMCIDLELFLALERVSRTAHDALVVVGVHSIGPKDEKRIIGLIQRFKEYVKDEHSVITTITSLAIGLLNDAIDATKNEKKFYAMMRVFVEICFVHELFDPKYDYEASYKDASELNKIWKKELGES